MRKYWKWIIGILILIVIVWLIIIGNKPRYFNQVELSNDNYIKNKTEMKYLDTILSVGLNELQIKGVTIYVRGISIKKNLGDLELKGHIIGIGNQYLLEIDKVSKSEVISILSHELIHLHQMNSGDLMVTEKYVIWKHDTLSDIKSYENREWEIEAFGLGEKLEKKINDVLYGK